MLKNNRINNLISYMKKEDIEQIFITSPSSIFYFTEKWIEPGERLLVLYVTMEGEIKLFINELFPIDEKIGIETLFYNDSEDPVNKMLSVIKKDKKIGIEKNWPSYFLIRLMNRCNELRFVDGSYIIDRVRMIKDKEEIELMKKSSLINDSVMEYLVSSISEKLTERELCKIILDTYSLKGAEDFSFYPLVAYGKNAAEPHHESNNTNLKIGDSIILDIGGKFNRYCSDMTRTVFYKKADTEHIKIYNTVLQANKRAIEKIKPGVRFKDIDNAAREYIESSGYGKYFTHRTGHNIGIDPHEFPDVSSVNNMAITEGMIFSIEPGIYVPKEVGVRIEDLVLVTANGCEVLNYYRKELQIV